jgi:hypothetical protein
MRYRLSVRFTNGEWKHSDHDTMLEVQCAMTHHFQYGANYCHLIDRASDHAPMEKQ